MSSIKFTQDHEWLKIDGDIVTIGITDFAQSQLGDVVYIELPDVGDTLKVGDEGAIIESVKAAGEIEVHIAGEVIDTNAMLSDDPEVVNRDPMGEGWFFKMRVEDATPMNSMMTQAEYQALIAEESE